MIGTKKIPKDQIADYISGTTQTALNAKQGTLTLTTTGTSGAATLVSDTLNIPQYSGGGGAAKEFLRLNYALWNFAGVAINTWFSWPRNSSIMTVNNPISLSQTTSPPNFIDANFLLVNNKTKLNKISWSMRDGATGQNIQIYVRSFTFANATLRGSETNIQVLVDETWTLPSTSSNGFKNNFTIASHTLDPITGIQIAIRLTSGTVSTLQGINLILEFE
jgi:hypothetical protein